MGGRRQTQYTFLSTDSRVQKNWMPLGVSQRHPGVGKSMRRPPRIPEGEAVDVEEDE